MDALVGFLDGPRARGAFVLRAVLRPPWSVRVEDRAPLTVVAMVRDGAVLRRDGEPGTAIGPGDVAIVRGPDPYTVADDPATDPQVVIHPGQRCTDLDGRDVHSAMALGVRTWGNDPDGTSVLVVGTYEERREISSRLLDALPPLAVVPADALDSPLVALLADEVARDEPGQAAVLDRLLDLLLVAAVRTWFARCAPRAPAWYAASADPVVGQALRLIHAEPATPWTVATLARACGVSRAALARRFADLVGEPPMRYLASWRLDLAADLLREPGATLAGVAREVGYGTPFALSAAFKRVRGISPKEHRASA